MNVLIRAPNWIGDAVMAVPALRELRRIFIRDQIVLAGPSGTAGLFEGETLADEIVELSAGEGAVKTAKAFISGASIIRRHRIDFAVLLQNAFSAAFMVRAGGAKRVIGYPTDGRRLLLSHSITFEPDYRSLHQVRYYLNIARQVEQKLSGKSIVNVGESQPRLAADDQARESARSLFANVGIDVSSKLLAINPGATNSRAKRWLPERFAETADHLAEKYGFEVLVIGSRGDLEIANRVAGLMKSGPRVLAGKTTIASLKGVLSSASLMISNDTGGAHVSAALGVPTVVVFGPTEHESTRPLSDSALVVRHPVECSPCMLRDCPIDHRCMTRVESEDVYKAAEQLLSQAAH